MSAILEKCFGESRWKNVAGAYAIAMTEISGHEFHDHNIELSMSTFKRRLKQLNSKRKHREELNMYAMTEIIKKRS